MPYAIPPDATLGVTIAAELFAQRILFTQAYRYEGPLIADGAAALAQLGTILNQIGGLSEAYLRCMPANLNSAFMRLQWLYPDRFRSVTVPTFATSGQAGLATTPNLQTALTVTGDIADRQGLATKKLLIPDDVIFEGEIEGAHLAKVRDLGAQLKLTHPMGAGQAVPVIIGKRPAGQLNLGRPITGSSFGTTVRVLRRRTLRVGE